MAKALVTTRTSVTVYNLADSDTYHDPAPQRTGTENEVFKARNVINFAQVSSANTMTVATASGALSNIIQILKIPKRTVVNNIRFGIPSGTAPSLSWSGSYANITFNVNLTAYTSASLSSTATAAKGGGHFNTSSSGGGITSFASVSASTPWTATVNPAQTGSSKLPAWFPNGGYIELQLSGGASTSSHAATIASGTMEVMAEGTRIPE